LKKTKVAALVILAVGFLGLFSVWVYRVRNGLHFVRKADYRLSIPDRPAASGEVYSIDRGRYLLVVVDRSSHHEAYCVNLDHKEIGLPSFDPSKYTPFSRSALVDEAALEGFPEIGRLTADWRVAKHEVGIRVTGRPPEFDKCDPVPADWCQQTMPIAYKTEIILTRTR